MQRQLPVLDLVSRVCGQMGLPIPIAVVAQTSNKLATQMLYLLNKVGEQLLKPVEGYRWQQFQTKWYLNTNVGQTIYPLPADFDSFIDNTGNSRSRRLPMVGPVAPPAWNRLMAWTMGPVIWVVYRTRGSQFELFNTPLAVENLIIDYTSRGWVQATAGGALKDQVTADDDVVLYDSSLAQAALKLAFLKEKGFDTTAAQNDYDLALELAINADSDAAILSAAGGTGIPLLDAWNVPQTGIGS